MVKLLSVLIMAMLLSLGAVSQDKKLNYTYNVCDVYNIDTVRNTAEYARTITNGGSITFSNMDKLPLIIVDYEVYNIVDAIRQDGTILFKTTQFDKEYPIMIELSNYSLRINLDNTIFVYKPLKNNN